MDVIYMKNLNLRKYFFLILASLTAFSLFSIPEEQIATELTFTGTEKFVLDARNDQTLFNYLNLVQDATLSLDQTVAFYTFSFRLNDALTFDFSRINEEPDKSSLRNAGLKHMIGNSTTFGIGNQFFFKNLFYGNIDFDLSLAMPFNENKNISIDPNADKVSLTINPIVKLGGSYFFGFDWEIAQVMPVRYVFEADNSSFKPGTTFDLKYEFFRFYGPRNLVLGIEAKETLTYAYYFNNPKEVILPYSSTLDHSLNASVYAKFYNVKPTVTFIHTFQYNVDGKYFNEFGTGFKAGVEYTLKQFNFAVNYQGVYKRTQAGNYWNSVFDVSVGFTLTK
jgi:hypothetical protein